jgi:hypothetical protein
MASSRVETQITWAAASSISVTAAATQTSDAFTFNAEDWDAALQINVDNNGTPAAGDTVDVWVAYTSGDILGDSGADYDTTEHATFVARLDTVAANTPGEDPARVTVPLMTAPGGFKVIVKNNAASNGITVRARVVTHRVA